MHTNERPFKCDQCDRAFVENCELLKHTRGTHTNERNFECKICQKTFKTHHSRRNHEVRNHEEKKYKCEMCDRSFSDSSDFSKHNSYYHAAEHGVLI